MRVAVENKWEGSKKAENEISCGMSKIKSNERMASEIPTSVRDRTHGADLDGRSNSKPVVCALVICGLGASVAEVFTHSGAGCSLTN